MYYVKCMMGEIKHFLSYFLSFLRSVVCAVNTVSGCAQITTLRSAFRGELPGLDQFLDRTSAVYSILLYTVASSIDYVIHQWHIG